MFNEYAIKGVVTETSYFYYLLIIISIGRLEATAGADGDIGRSSTVDHSKALDLCFP